MAAVTVPRHLSTGQPAPVWSLPALDGTQVSLEDFHGRLLVMNFWSAECPWSQRADLELTALTKTWGEQVALATVASNANESPELIRATAQARGLPLVLVDPAGAVADLYGAAATPHLFVIDGQGTLRYQGALDDATFRRRTPSQHYLRSAVEALLAGRLPDPAETPAYGCALVRYVP
jgi:peroxiredoxin